MHHKRINVCISILILLFFIASALPLQARTSITLYVDDDQAVSWYDTTHVQSIQEAVENAIDGDTIYIYAGVYHAQYTWQSVADIDKSLTLLGEDKSTTIIESQGSTSPLTLSANDITLSGVTLKNGYRTLVLQQISGIRISDAIITGSSDSGITIWGATDVEISDTTVSDNSGHGIEISDSSTFVTITENTISNNQDFEPTEDGEEYGIYLADSSNNQIRDNTISTNGWGEIKLTHGNNIVIEKNQLIGDSNEASTTGIEIWYSSDNTISDNTIIGEQEGGIHLFYSSKNLISANTISDCQFDGAISLADDSDTNIISDNTITQSTGIGAIAVYTDDNIISGNTISDCSPGMRCEGDNNQIMGNIFENNELYGLYVRQTKNTLVYHNSFINNKDVSDQPSNAWDYQSTESQWDNNYPSGGNYWDDYQGVDANDDGIGDTPYQVPAYQQNRTGVFSDRYPLMYSYPQAPLLEVESPVQVDESERFQIIVKSNGKAISSALVFFSGESYLTDSNGRVTITAPSLPADETFTLSVYKGGYQEVHAEIQVISLELDLGLPERVLEQEPFIITVYIKGTTQPVAGAMVTFNGETLTTDTNGQVTFSAPVVSEDITYPIMIDHESYATLSSVVIVLNREQRASIHVVSPNSKESISKQYTIQWTITSDDSLNQHMVSLYYQYAAGLWVNIADELPPTSTSHTWNTESIIDGYPYLVRAVLRYDDNQDGVYEEIVSEDTSDASFAIDNSQTHQGWIQGTVTQNHNTSYQPVENAVVCVIISDIDNVVTSKCMITNATGEYRIPLRVGSFQITVSAPGYSTTSIENISIWVQETTVLDFTLDPGVPTGPTLFFVGNYREEINDAIHTSDVGGEVTILSGATDGYEQQVLIYDSVSIDPITVETDQVTVRINGDEKSAGKTLVFNLEDTVLDFSQEIRILYDGHPILLADDLADVLNPNDDGLAAEYLMTIGEEGMQILISIPHFSEHEITITSLVEGLTSQTALLYYLLIAVVLAILFYLIVDLNSRL